MVQNRSGLKILLGIGALSLVGGNALHAQQTSTENEITWGNVRISGYKKIHANLRNANLHFIGPTTTLEVTDTGRHTQHRLSADDIQINKKHSGISAELTGNVHYTLLQGDMHNKAFEATAEHAVYQQTEAGAISLQQVHANFFRSGNSIADMTSKQITANSQDQTVVGTGGVRITGLIQLHLMTLTADTVTWNRRANTVVATGAAQVTHVGIDGKEAVTHANRITMDLTSQDLDIE